MTRKRVIRCQGCDSTHVKRTLTRAEQKEFKETGKAPHFGSVYKIVDNIKVVEDYFVPQFPNLITPTLAAFVKAVLDEEAKTHNKKFRADGSKVKAGRSSLWIEETLPSILRWHREDREARELRQALIPDYVVVSDNKETLVENSNALS